MVTFPGLVAAVKTIPLFPGWTNSEPETGYVWFDVPLDIEGVTSDLYLHGGTYLNHPESSVTFEIVARSIQGRRRIPLIRIDWRSLKRGHTNPRSGPPEHAGRRVSETHIHSFELNWVETEGRMRKGNLPFAMEICEELQGFEPLCNFVGESFRINNMNVVLEPEWEYDLFHD